MNAIQGIVAGAALAWAGPGASTGFSQDAEASTRFAVVGHVRGDDNGALLQNLDELIEELDRLDLDFVLMTGDLVWGDVNAETTDLAAVEADWDTFDARFAALGIPIYPVPGNHDINDRGTRDLFLERYGPLPRSVDHGNIRVLLLSSAWIPEDDDPRKHPPTYIRGMDLGDEQVSFIASELERGGAEHVFLGMHHMLWWHEGSAWWHDVHPLFEGHPVRAAFAGDYGPLKFSHLERDGVDYIQSSIENTFTVDMLKAKESSRVLSAQLDNFLLVTVEGPETRIEVRTLGALTTDKFTPALYREVHEYDKWSLGWRIRQRFPTSSSLVGAFAIAGVVAFFSGAGLAGGIALILKRRRGTA